MKKFTEEEIAAWEAACKRGAALLAARRAALENVDREISE